MHDDYWRHGCQQEIAGKIIDQGANYILAVKKNQKQLHQDIIDEFRFGKNIHTDITEELDHGRIETRKCSVIKDFNFIENIEEWTGLNSIIRIESAREFKNSDKPTETATKYYISSLLTGAQELQNAIRLHWGIENILRKVLDISFSEDASRKRAGNASQ